MDFMKHLRKRNGICLIIICFCFVMTRPIRVNAATPLKSLTDKYGRAIGVVYNGEDKRLSGELVLDFEKGRILFKSCKTDVTIELTPNLEEIEFGNRNCRRQLAILPKGLFAMKAKPLTPQPDIVDPSAGYEIPESELKRLMKLFTGKNPAESEQFTQENQFKTFELQIDTYKQSR